MKALTAMPAANTTLDDIASVIGLSATVRLSVWFGGLSNLYVPISVSEGQLLCKLVGLPAAKRMTAEWGGMWLTIPRMGSYEAEVRRNLVGRMLTKGFGCREVARLLNMSSRRVQQICRELEQAGLIKIVAPTRNADDVPAKHDEGFEPARVLAGTLFPTANPDLDDLVDIYDDIADTSETA